MSRQKGAVQRSLEDCLNGAKLAFEDDLLSDFRDVVVATAWTPDRTWREAIRRLKGIRATVDLRSRDSGLCRSYWWLAKLKRDYPEEFYAKVQKMERVKMEEKKHVYQMDFPIPPQDAELTTITRNRAGKSETHFSLRFHSSWADAAAWNFCARILSGIAESIEFGKCKPETCSDVDWDSVKSKTEKSRAFLAQLVEEKFGLKVRVCMNCKFYKEDRRGPQPLPERRSGLCGKVQRPESNRFNINPAVWVGDTCVNNMLNGVMNCWEPKE